MAKSIPEILKFGEEDHSKLATFVVGLRDLWNTKVAHMRDRWKEADRMDRLYVSDTDQSDSGKHTKTMSSLDFTMPIVVPYSKICLDVMASALSLVFMTWRHLLPVGGRGPDDVMPAQAMQHVLDYQVSYSKAKLHFMAVIKDFLKYSHGVVGTSWRTEYGTEETWEPVADEYGGVFELQRVEKPFLKYEGNQLRQISPRRFIHDPRVPIAKFQEGQFAGETVPVPYFTLYKNRIRGDSGLYFNLEEAKKAASKTRTHEELEETPGENAGREAPADNEDSRYDESNPFIDLIEMVVEIIPSQFKLPGGEEPQKYLISVAGGNVIVRCHPKSYGYDEFPYDVVQYDLDRESLFGSSMLQNLEGMQDIVNFLVNAHIESSLQHLRNTLIVDDRYVNPNYLTNPKLNQVIVANRSLPPYANWSTHAVHQLPLHDNTVNLMVDSQHAFDLMQRLTGASDNLQGMETAKKQTATESGQRWQGSMRAVQVLAILVSEQLLKPLTRKWIGNTQKLLQEQNYYRIEGEWVNATGVDAQALGLRKVGSQNFANIPPDMLRRAVLDYEPLDASRPITPHEMADVMSQIVSAFAANPTLAMEYDIAPIVEMWARAMGITDIARFRRSPQEKEQIQQMAQGGARGQAMPDEQVAQQVDAGRLQEMPQIVQ